MKYVCNLVLLQLAFWYLSKYDFSTCIITVLHFFLDKSLFSLMKLGKKQIEFSKYRFCNQIGSMIVITANERKSNIREKEDRVRTS